MKRLSIALVLLVCTLHAMEINATIANGDAQTYESLLASLKKNPVDNDEKALQEALLYKLINLTRNAKIPEAKIAEPKNEASLKQLIAQYGEWALERAKIQRDLEDLKAKLSTIDDQLAQLAPNDPQALTLQLQHAFYLKGERLYREKIARDTHNLQAATRKIVEAVRTVSIDKADVQKRLADIQKRLDTIHREKEKLDVEKERLNLLGRTSKIAEIDRRQHLLNAQYERLLNDKLMLLFMKFSAALHDKKSGEVFSLHHEILQLAKKEYPPEVASQVAKLLATMERKILGRAETLKGATLEEAKTILSMIWAKANAPLFSIGQTPVSAIKITIALFVFLFGFFVGAFYKKSIRQLTFKSETITLSTQTLLANLGYYLIVVVAFFIALNILGINLSSIALVAGALSVGIGFGLQNIVSNFVSGLILMFERSIKIGDYVELDNDLRGHVSDIRMRSTTITTNDNIDVIVPNQDLIQNHVINWTMNDRIRRFRIPFGVAYGSDIHHVEKVILQAVERSGFTDIFSDYRRKTRVIMTGMGDSSVDFELFVWVRGNEMLYPRRTRSRFLKLIYDALYEAGIEIPFPQRDIHIRSVDGEIPLRYSHTPLNGTQR